MKQVIKIGTRDSQLAIWQASLVQDLLQKNNFPSELVYIKSEGDLDTITPLYELGVQGIFTKTLDTALLNHRIDVAVHSMKDVPTKLAEGLKQAAVLERASFKDILVYKGDLSDVSAELGLVNGQWSMVNKESKNSPFTIHHSPFIVATSSIRRIAQWLHRYPNHVMENLRGNINTRLKKVSDHNWSGAIFAAAGLERINLRPQNSVDLDWMLPAPAQGAIVIVCRQNDSYSYDACNILNDSDTALCTKIEKDFLRALSGGCSTPISGLAKVKNDKIIFQGNICSPDGKQIIEIEKESTYSDAGELGYDAGNELLQREEVQKLFMR